MTHEPEVDVVMAANRITPYLEKALASLRAQTYQRWRFIFVDDGSGRAEDLDRLVAEVPRSTIIHQAPAGVSTARNAGISAGRGEVVTFLDDDDIWPADRLAASVRVLAHRPTAIGAFGDGIYIDEAGVSFGGWSSPPATAEEFLRGAVALPRITTLSLRRTALERIGLFVDGMNLAEDTELALRALRHGELVHAEAVLVEYRRHGSNVTNTDWRLLHRAGARAIALNVEAAASAGDEHHVRLLRENRRRYDRRGAAEGFGRVITEARSGSYRAALTNLRDSFAISPVGLVHGAGARIGTWLTRSRRNAA